MAKYFINSETLKEIADAIKEKTKNQASMYPTDMPSRIRSITTTSSNYENIDQGVIDEANRVSNSILSRTPVNEITFIAMSDTHEMGDTDHTDTNIISSYRLANQHAAQGAKLIADRINPDFFAHLGDYSWGAEQYKNGQPVSWTKPYDFFKSIDNVKSYLHDTTKSITSFTIPGNHDATFDWVNEHNEFATDDYIAATIGNYKYIDFDNKKVRVIALNTAERLTSSNSNANMSDAQLLWFAQALDLSSKSNFANWQIIILSHHPIGTKYLSKAASILEAYVNGTSITIGSSSYNFNGKNTAKIIANFHGHVHCFKTGNIIASTELPIKRIAIPNACRGRNNEYGKDGDLVYGEPAKDTCPGGSSQKSSTPGQDTAFCVIRIDLDKKIVYADCFGSLGDTLPGPHAGYDRTISYAANAIVTHTITYNLTNADSSNKPSSIISGNNYTTTISPFDNYMINTIKVTMEDANGNPQDITSVVLNGKNITITNVTGNIVITATTTIIDDFEYGEFTNLVPDSTSYGSTAIYGEDYNEDGTPDGYKNDYCISSSAAPYEKSATGFVITGYMPYIVPNPGVPGTIYIKGADWSTTSANVRLNFYKEDKTPIQFYLIANRLDDTNNNIEKFYTKEILGDSYYKFTPIVNTASSVGNWMGLTTVADMRNCKYMRLSLEGTGENLIVTVNQPIHAGEESDTPSEPVTYTVTINTNDDVEVTGNTTVKQGESYSATFYTTGSYCPITYAKITMEGTGDITSTALQYDDDSKIMGTISISNVTGNIVIVMEATEISNEPSYNVINQLLKAQSLNSETTIYGTDYDRDGTNDGYLKEVRLSENASGNGNTGSSTSGGANHMTTGWIPYTYSNEKDANGEYKNAIYIKNLKLDTSDDHCRIYCYETKAATPPGGSAPGYTKGTTMGNHFTMTDLSSNGTYYYKFTPTKALYDSIKYVRLSLVYKDSNGEFGKPIITFGEPIE